MEKWVAESLADLLNFRDAELAQYIIKIDNEKALDDYLGSLLDFKVRYIIKIDNEKALDDYLGSLLDFKDSKHRQFVTELKRRRASSYGAASSTDKKTNNGNQKSAHRQNDKKRGKPNEKEKENVAVQPVARPIERIEKKKTKFVNLYSQEGKDRQTVLLKGRYRCDCEARIHALINNCLSCGRIVCEQEKAGPCLHCDTMVCTPSQQAVLSSQSKQSSILRNQLMDQKPAKLSENALKHRDKLLEYDRNSSRRTEVIDDENDYYQSSNSVWLSTTEREKMHKREEEMRNKKYESRLTQKVTLDFAGRAIVEEPAEDFYDALNTELRESAESMIARIPDDANVCPLIDFDRPSYVDMNILNIRNSVKQKIDNRTSSHNRIQDKEYLEMVDEGVCLSLHQPYASLLVAGIKTHEGRGWYSSHRGRLWIAAASAVPDTTTISMLENRYRVLLSENIKFPPNYPTGCLLGCVTVSEVLPREEYRRAYPEGDSDSPFVFICQDCHELPLKFPMQGKHKIYKLEKKIHQAAMKCLEQSLKLQGK